MIGQGATPNTSVAPKICPSQQNYVADKKKEQNYDTNKTALPTKKNITAIPTKENRNVIPTKKHVFLFH
jgi:hypothetical protein